MAYSDKVIDHYNNPRNVGNLDKKDPNVGTGLVGAPECGDVMKLQIKINPETQVIEDAKFKTFGCLASNNLIATPKGYVPVSMLRAGDEVWAWNGTAIVKNRVKSNTQSSVHYTKLVKLDFGLRKTIVCTNDHVWWLADNRPIEAQDLAVGMELLCATKNEFSSLNNVGKQPWMRELAATTMSQTNSRQNIHARLPQNKKGYLHHDAFKNKVSAASKRNWANPQYVKKWQDGMAGASEKRPTKLEQTFIGLFKSNGIDARYVGNGEFWVNGENGAKLNPDFKVNGQRKVIEVYDSGLPAFMMNRSTPDWIIARKQQFAAKGYDVMFIEVREAEHCVADVQRFIHNGIELKSIHAITDKRDLRGLERIGDDVMVYDLELEEGANIFFVQRVMSHNCGSAIASSSLATEWVKGRTVDEALTIKNTEIVKELNLPPVKIHCSVLAEDAIKAAIRDYQHKQGSAEEQAEEIAV